MQKLNIRFYREKKGMTRKELADAIGVSEAEIIAYERGMESPLLDKFIRIAEVLGVSLGDLVKKGE